MAIQTIQSSGRYASNNTAQRQQGSGRSFAELYQSALAAAGNDNASVTRIDAQDSRQNRQYIETLHNGVDTLRGEILARAIETGRAEPQQAVRLTEDITRLSVRLDKLRQKLHAEESRLSGKLVDITI